MRSHETTIEHEQTKQGLQYLATLVAFSEDAVIGKTLDGTIEYWNKAAERMYGYTAEEVVGKSVSIIVPPDRLESGRAVHGEQSLGRRLGTELRLSEETAGQIALRAV